MRLHIGMQIRGMQIGRMHIAAAKEPLHALARQLFDHVHELAAAVVSPARVALGVFVRQHAADGLHHRRAGVILAGDHLQAVLLTADLALDGRPDFGVLLLNEVDHVAASPPKGRGTEIVARRFIFDKRQSNIRCTVAEFARIRGSNVAATLPKSGDFGYEARPPPPPVPSRWRSKTIASSRVSSSLSRSRSTWLSGGPPKRTR